MAPPKSSQKPAKSKTERSVSVQLPSALFPVILYFNRCGVQDVEGHKMLHFGFVAKSSGEEELVAAYACLLEKSTISANREQWVKYLASIGLPENEDPMDWRVPYAKIASLPMANLATFSRADGESEFRFYNMSIGDAVTNRDAGDTTAILGQPLALLRCSVSLQRSILVSLYAELPG
jgi:hypothetical protein